MYYMSFTVMRITFQSGCRVLNLQIKLIAQNIQFHEVSPVATIPHDSMEKKHVAIGMVVNKRIGVSVSGTERAIHQWSASSGRSHAG